MEPTFTSAPFDEVAAVDRMRSFVKRELQTWSDADRRWQFVVCVFATLVHFDLVEVSGNAADWRRQVGESVVMQ